MPRRGEARAEGPARRWSCRRQSAARRREGPARGLTARPPRPRGARRRSTMADAEGGDGADRDDRGGARCGRPPQAREAVERVRPRRPRPDVVAAWTVRAGVDRAEGRRARGRSTMRRQVRHRHVEHDGACRCGRAPPSPRPRPSAQWPVARMTRVVRCRASSPGCRGSRAPQGRSRRRGRCGTGCRPRRGPEPPRRRARTRKDRRP